MFSLHQVFQTVRCTTIPNNTSSGTTITNATATTEINSSTNNPLLRNKTIDAGARSFGCYTNPHKDGSCPYEHITFWLYTRKNKEGIQVTNKSMTNLPIDKDKPWKIIFHGFDSSKKDPGELLKDAYLARGSYNVLVLDYSEPVGGLAYCYFSSLGIIDLLGGCSADFLYKMIKSGILPAPSKLHMIGHSLGAHIAAHTSFRLREMTNNTVDRITGLDPAGMLISDFYTKARNRLDPTDAKFVDAHHTNNGVLAAGTTQDVGTVGIWYNYNRVTLFQIQPGCPSILLPISAQKCSHRRAIEYFAESIKPLPLPPNSTQFVGTDNRRRNIGYLVGEDVPRGPNEPKGDLYVYTNPKSPYAQDQYK
ncbi:hypothetical protein WDU94_007472 [Cyamophila willieti]